MEKDKTVEELQEELNKLKQENLRREIEAEKAKVEAAKQDEAQKEKDALAAKIREEVMAELKGNSMIKDEHEVTTMQSDNSKWENFKQQYVKRSGLQGLSYDDLCHKAYTDAMYR